MRVFLFFLLTSCVTITHGQALSFKVHSSPDSFYLSLANHLYGPVYLKFSPVDSFKNKIRLPQEVVICSKDSLTNLVAVARDAISGSDSLEWSSYFSVFATLGDPDNSRHDDRYVYTLPFPEGKSYSIIQSWNGKFSHRSKKSRYAIDFDLAIGDTICAARDGVVILTKEKFRENGGRDFRDKANQVVVLHSDGTLGFYVHLMYKGVLVEPGEQVRAGEPIGLSGNTGYSTRPHLHFVVRQAPDRSVPVYFKGYIGQRLKKGKKYPNHF